MQLCRRSALVLAVIALTSTPACALNAPAPFAAKELGLQTAVPHDADFDRPFEAPLPAKLGEAQGKGLIRLASCRDYLAVRDRMVGSDTDAAYRVVRLQTVPCTALALLRSAGAPTHTALAADFLQETATSSYPASLWPAVSDDERQQLAQPGATLQTASGKPALLVVNGEALELEASNYGLRLTLLARGDFDHDGWEDVALRWEAHSVKGSYTDARLVVLTRTGKESSLRELALDKLLPAR